MIFVECKADETLISSFFKNDDNIHHSNGKGGVCENLSNTTHSIGVVDKDSGNRQPRYMDSLMLIESDDNFEIYVDETKKNKLIVLCPKLEGWLIKACEEISIDLDKYKLSKDENRLHAIVNLNMTKLEKIITMLSGRSPIYMKLEKYLINT
jgi:hypothetical protein